MERTMSLMGMQMPLVGEWPIGRMLKVAKIWEGGRGAEVVGEKVGGLIVEGGGGC